MTAFYRFRSTRALLDEWQELEKQEIYFCPPEDLNDPIEGFIDLFWQGDPIVWRNLLRHYVLCLMKTVTLAMVLGKDQKPGISKELILATRTHLPTPQYTGLYERVCAVFFAVKDIDTLPRLLADCPHPFRRDDLAFCLRGLHPIAFNAIIRVYRENKMIPDASPLPAAPEYEAAGINALKTTLTTIAAGNVDPEEQRALFLSAGLLYRQIDLIKYVAVTDELSRAWHSIFYSFPEQYVDRLKDLIFFEWYAACFVADPNQAAMWGNYGDAHKGVCLKFRAEDTADGRPTLKLHCITGWPAGPQGSGPNYGERVLQFDKMTYVDKFPAVDFFRSMGRVQAGALMADWYTDESGNVSPCADGILSTTGEWHRKYWDSFQTLVTMKLRDWEHEDECRLVLTSTLDAFSDPKERKSTYRFADLEGIVFGIRTTPEDKERIINIIDAKCKVEGRKEFTFGQATYEPHTGKIEVLPLDLLRFE